ncbi:hypothetical protein [Pseudomonas mucidolens]|uniref:hypothetical protein n=1 Tax=Pseudomonas mucidolens TaxID=46679 RepID=UPI0030DB4529
MEKLLKDKQQWGSARSLEGKRGVWFPMGGGISFFHRAALFSKISNLHITTFRRTAKVNKPVHRSGQGRSSMSFPVVILQSAKNDLKDIKSYISLQALRLKSLIQ